MNLGDLFQNFCNHLIQLNFQAIVLYLLSARCEYRPQKPVKQLQSVADKSR